MNIRFRMVPVALAFLFTTFSVLPSTASSQTPGTEADQTADPANENEGWPNDRANRLAKYLSGSAFVGRYTHSGEGDQPGVERYNIASCKLLPDVDHYELKVRIRYGGTDAVAPLKVKIVFADKTPVITLDQTWIPGLGTFDARVLIRDGRYAGTWSHDEVGGHVFGKIDQAE